MLEPLPTISILSPLDQPFGGIRFNQWLKEALASRRYTILRIMVAYAKEGALLRLEEAFKAFTGNGGQIQAVFGIDQCGTSKQALEFAVRCFANSWVWQHPNLMVTFHPKVYSFEGAGAAELHVGSCNLTTGGLEVNCESAVRLAYQLPTEAAEWADATSGWNHVMAHPNLRALNSKLIATLHTAGLTLDERAGSRLPKQTKSRAAIGLFPGTSFVPPSTRPRPYAKHRGTSRALPRAAAAAAARAAIAGASLPSSLLIQIVPHHNGEVFLSKRAVDQHPAFFGYPFSGLTTPKTDNLPYPQRLPDPVTDWIVRDLSGAAILSVVGFPLNTVYYEAKSEIRITVSPELRASIPADSVLQMTRITDGPADYSCEVFPPGSPQFGALLAACDQEMPSGGKPTARRFGWV